MGFLPLSSLYFDIHARKNAHLLFFALLEEGLCGESCVFAYKTHGTLGNIRYLVDSLVFDIWSKDLIYIVVLA